MDVKHYIIKKQIVWFQAQSSISWCDLARAEACLRVRASWRQADWLSCDAFR